MSAQKCGLLSGSLNPVFEAHKFRGAYSKVCGLVYDRKTLRISEMLTPHNGLVAGSSPAGPTRSNHLNPIDNRIIWLGP